MSREHGFLRAYSRVTSNGRFIPEVDGIRFIAIGCVILYHLEGFVAARLAIPGPERQTSLLARVAMQGHYGVQLFFVLSGFILAIPFARQYLTAAEPVRLKSYYLRRLSRLEVPYLTNLVLMFTALVLVNGADVGEMGRHLVASAFYQHGNIYGKLSPVNAVTWSLEVEVQFYVLVPLLTKVFAIPGTKRRRCVILGTIVGAMLVHLIPPAELGRLTLSVVYFVGYFLAGFLLADVFIVDWHEAPSSHWFWDLVSLVIWPTIYLVAAANGEMALLLPLLLLLAYIAVFRSIVVRAILTQTLLTTIGGMCYTIYLYHYALIAGAGRLTSSLSMPTSYTLVLVTQLALLAPVVLVGSAVMFRCVERPCMRRDWPARLGAWARTSVFVPAFDRSRGRGGET